MTAIYQNFAKEFKGINQTVVGNRLTFIGGDRAYLVKGKPYFSNIHFPSVSESWFTHESLQRHFKSNAELHGRIWGGTAGEVNLSYMAVSKAPAAILFDINPFQTLFWNQFFEMLGEISDPQLFAVSSRQFLKDFYFDLKNQFNLQAIQKDHPGLHMQSPDPKDHMVSVEEQIRRRKQMYSIFDYSEEVDCSDITEPRCLDHVEELSSPIKNMNYKQFYKEIRTYLGWKNTGSISCADKDVQWIANEEHYNHLHLMAKNNAIATITLDVTDAPSCNQLKKHMDSVRYNPVQIINGKTIKQTPRQGSRIESMYLSNMLYYLDYSEEEVAELAAKNKKPFDFSGNEISRDSYAATLQNLRALTNKDSRILRFDSTSPSFMGRLDFEPLFSVSKDNISIPKTHEAGGLAL